MSDRTFEILPELESKIAEIIKQKFAIDIFAENFANSSGARKMAQAVLKLSDFFISAEAQPTPWEEPWCQLAYLSYYMILNEIRCRAVLQEAERTNYLSEVEQVTDFGAGLGAATYSLSKVLPSSTQYVHIEKALTAQTLHKNIFPADTKNSRWTDLPGVPAKNSLGVFSFSLNELSAFPEWILQFDRLMIIEPATSQQGRVLMENRKKLIERGFHIWAPCTHQEACPLLEKSKNDWCHDRVFFQQPEWFQASENHLPIKNQTLTFSYLLAAKTPPPALKGMARITGDFLDEKGKSRQLVCRNSEREFLAWMHKNLPKKTEPQRIPRGAMIYWPSEFEQKSNEIRVTKEISILALDKKNPS